MVGFVTPKGWHYRIYDDFIWLKTPGWLLARHVTLYYNGLKTNEFFGKRLRSMSKLIQRFSGRLRPIRASRFE